MSSIATIPVFRCTKSVLHHAPGFEENDGLAKKIQIIAIELIKLTGALCVDGLSLVPILVARVYVKLTNVSSSQNSSTNSMPDRRQALNATQTHPTTLSTMASAAKTAGILLPVANGPERGLTGTKPLPWGYLPMSLAGGMIMSSGQTYEDESKCGQFTKDAQLMAFQDEYRVKFPLHFSKEHQVTLPTPVKEQIGIPKDAEKFCFIYPGALSMKVTLQPGETEADRKALIMDKLQSLRPELRHLLTIGGYIYYNDQTWKAGQRLQPGERWIEGINVLDPTFSDDPRVKKLYFGQAKIVPPSVVKQLERLAETTDRYFNPSTQSWFQTTAYPAMWKITVGPLLEKGLTHFKWLPPKDPMIQHMGDRTFGEAGAFVYYSKNTPQISCMMPVVTPEQWKEMMRSSTYLNIPQEGGDRSIYVEDGCVINAACSPTNRPELIVLNPCGHANTCSPCFEEMKQINSGNICCPLCRAVVTSTEPLPSNLFNFKPFTELRPFTLSLGKIAPVQNSSLSQFMHQMIKAEWLRSPPTQAESLPASLKISLNIGTFQSVSFIYPLYGKPLDLTHNLLNQANQLVFEDETEGQKIQGLLASGGFIVYDRDQVRDIYGIWTPPEGTDPHDVVSLNCTPEGPSTNNQTPFSSELARFKNVQVSTFNLSRITLQSLLPFAKFFQWTGQEFVYSQGREADWRATLT